MDPAKDGLAMDRAALDAFVRTEFGQVSDSLGVVEASLGGVTLRLLPSERHLRPGGTVSGPSMFELADVALYLAILSRIGPVALAVTTNAHIDFMRKPAAGVPLLGKARLLKLGRTLAVGQVSICSEGSEDVLAQASLTYSIPPDRTKTAAV